MRNVVVSLSIVALALGGSAACATKKFVRTQVGEVNSKVDTLSKSVEDTQERTRQNEAKITEVEGKAVAAGRSAEEAKTAATAADSKAVAAGTKAEAAGAKAEEVDRATRKLIFEVVISEDQGNFKFAKAELPDPAKAELDKMVEQLKAEKKNVYLEIEGHTDNVGSAEYNHQLGLERAEQVKRYLYEAHQVPLHKMNVISYGEEKPAAPNKTREGRAQNRRVVVKVLA